MVEQWIEQYHQQAHRMDTRWRGQQFKDQARLRANRESGLRHHETKAAAEKYTKFHSVKKRKRSTAFLAKKERIKTEREGAFEKVAALLMENEASL